MGDWQTPAALADAALNAAMGNARAPASVLEPTCGEGTFLVAAARKFPRALLVGHELQPSYAEEAKRRLGARARIEIGSFFEVDWARAIAALPEPILVTGNPPWVTNAGLGVLGSANLPRKENFKRLAGLDALTGKSNFDVSEWMILRLLEALEGRRAKLAVLCKSIVARRIVERVGHVRPGGLWSIDAKAHFGASVDAVLFVCETGRSRGTRWPVYGSLDATAPSSWLGVEGGVLIADSDRYERTRHLAGTCEPEWRSGIKHDCARVMELERVDRHWVNGLGERVDVEPDFVFPMLKSSDVANDRGGGERAMIVPQRSLADDTRLIRREAPRLWRYLSRHKASLDARKSSIYREKPPFAIFGVGAYSFAPWKVAVSGLYKKSVFTLVGPRAERPVVLDDTCYFLAFPTEQSAKRALRALRSPLAQDFFASRIFWDAKRPITKALLQSLDLSALS